MNPDNKELEEELRTEPKKEAIEQVKDNSETILFIRNPKARKEKRLIEREYNKTFPMYKGIETQFATELFEIKDTPQQYKSLYDYYNTKWKRTCDYNYVNKRHLFTIPNKFYFENKYRPIEQDTRQVLFARVRQAIQNTAGKVKYIEG